MKGGPRYKRRDGRTVELAVLVGGRWNGCWYWRDELEMQQAAARDARRRCSTDVPMAKAAYKPTDTWQPNPEKPTAEGREWHWTGSTQ